MADYSQGYSDETKEAGGGGGGGGGGSPFGESAAKLLALAVVAGHILFYDVLPATLAWVVSSADTLNLFSGFENPSFRRVAALGVFLSAVGAVITTETITRLGRPFSVGNFLAVVVVIGLALFPFLAEWHQLRLGLTPQLFAFLQSYCSLALRVMVGILIGATLSWILLARPEPFAPRPQYTRK